MKRFAVATALLVFAVGRYHVQAQEFRFRQHEHHQHLREEIEHFSTQCFGAVQSLRVLRERTEIAIHAHDLEQLCAQKMAQIHLALERR